MAARHGVVAAVANLVLLLSSVAHGGDAPPSSVALAARTGLASFIAGIPVGEADKYGLGECPTVTAAELSAPLRVYTVARDKALAASATSDPLDVISPADTWVYVAHCGEYAGALLTIAMTPNGWEAVDFGGATHGSKLMAVFQRWPQADGYAYRFVRDPALEVAFVVLLESPQAAGALGVVPFEGPTQQPQAMPWKPRLETFSDILAFVQARLLKLRGEGGATNVH